MKKSIIGSVATLLLAVTITFAGAGNKKTTNLAASAGACCAKASCVCTPSPDGKSCICTGCPDMPNCVCSAQSYPKLNGAAQSVAKAETKKKSCPNTPDCICE